MGARDERLGREVLAESAGAGQIIRGEHRVLVRHAGVPDDVRPQQRPDLSCDLGVPVSGQTALPLLIFREARGAFAAGQERAWAGALELMVLILILSLVARLIGRKIHG